MIFALRGLYPRGASLVIPGWTRSVGRKYLAWHSTPVHHVSVAVAAQGTGFDSRLCELASRGSVRGVVLHFML